MYGRVVSLELATYVLDDYRARGRMPVIVPVVVAFAHARADLHAG